MKTKPTQHSVKELRSLGIQPNILVVRTEKPVPQSLKDKLASFCDVDPEAVIESRDVETLYSIPLALQAQNMDQIVCDHLKLDAPVADMTEWIKLEEKVLGLKKMTRIALVGKYVELPDAYLSVVEALKHAGFEYDSDIQIDWVNAEHVTDENVASMLKEADGILVPGGFGERGVEGKILAAKFARENNLPYFGICLGMQVALIEFARNVAGMADAHSTEFNKETPFPVVGLITEWIDEEGNVEQRHEASDLGGTMRLGAQLCHLLEGSKAAQAYKGNSCVERHRHRYEVNNKYRERLEQAGMIFSGLSSDRKLVEMIELKDHPWFVAGQFHPEFTSTPRDGHPLFEGFIAAASAHQKRDLK